MVRSMKKELIGACGIYCPGCSIYIAWKNDNAELKRKIAENISKKVGKKINPQDIKCTGCRGPIETHWSENCEIMLCATAKNVDMCSLCDEFICDKLKKFYERGYEDARKNCLRVKEIGLDVWFEEMKKVKRRNKVFV